MTRNQRNAPRDGSKAETRGYGCAVCRHSDRDAIDSELVAGVVLSKLSARYGMSTASLSRHRTNHISKALIALRPALPADATTLQHLQSNAARLEALVAQAEKAGRADQVTAGSRELRITLEAIAKAKGESNGPPPVGVNIQTSAEWHAIRAIIWDVLEPYDHLRVEIGKRLIALDGKSKT